MAAHFNQHGDKNTAMKDMYPNNHGDNQQPDSWESFILLCKDAMDGLVFITQKKMAAEIAFGSLTNLKSDLQALKRLLPLFLINKITKEVLENKAEELINNQDHFWAKYINFLDNYPTDAAQITNIRLIYPAYEVYQEMTFAQQMNHIKEKSPLMLQISNPDVDNLVLKILKVYQQHMKTL